MKRRAFTLVELLLVVAIVGALCALVFAVMGPAREKARQGVCVSNLRQIGQAFALYIADYDGMEPVKGVRMTHSQLGLPHSSRADDVFRQDYIKNREIMYCPSYHGAEPAKRGWGNTYQLTGVGWDDPDRDLPGVIAARGREFPLAICRQHNAMLNFEQLPRWETLTVIVLRLNQQIQTKRVPSRPNDQLTW